MSVLQPESILIRSVWWVYGPSTVTTAKAAGIFSPVSRHKNQKGTGNLHLLIQYKQVHLQKNIFFGWSQNIVQKFFGCQTEWNSPWLFFSAYDDKWQSDARGWKKTPSIVPGEEAWFQEKVETAFSAEKAQAPAPILSRCFSPLPLQPWGLSCIQSAAEHWLATGLPSGLKACGKVPTVNLRWYLSRWRKNNISLFPLGEQERLYP